MIQKDNFEGMESFNASLLSSIIQNALDGIALINETGIIISVNPTVLKMFQYDESELIGQNVKILMPASHKMHHDDYLRNYNQTGEAKIIGIGREVSGQKKDGTLFPLKLGVSKIVNENEIYFVGILHDLSKEKESEERLREYADELEKLVEQRTRTLAKTVKELEEAKDELNVSLEKEKELNQLKTRFVSIASHEFRTPLSSIKLSASLLEKYASGENADKSKKHVQKIKSAISYLTDLLNDFLSMDKIEQGKVNVYPVRFNLVQFLEHIIEDLQHLAKRGQIITYNHTGTENEVFLDENLLRQCVYNLVSNAIKYSGENTLIECNSTINKELIMLEVKDNGIGIPKEDQKHLFELFFRAHNAVNIPGTGLGLNIVKKYTGMMKGIIDFKSDEISGTSFKITIKKATDEYSTTN